MVQLSRERYAQLYGPTTGDRIRLADTDLLVEVEEDRCGGPGRAGEEAVFGGGKVIRESMGQSRTTRAEGAPDLVITGAVILDHWAVVKADVGVRDGRIVQIGRAAELVLNPADEYVADFTRDVPRDKIVTAGDILEPTEGGAVAGDGVPASEPLGAVLQLFASRRKPVPVFDISGTVIGQVSLDRALAALSPDQAS